MIKVIVAYLKAIKSEEYKRVTTVTLVSIQWGIAIINEAIESGVSWTNVDYEVREALLKSLFELVYYCTCFCEL